MFKKNKNKPAIAPTLSNLLQFATCMHIYIALLNFQRSQELDGLKGTVWLVQGHTAKGRDSLHVNQPQVCTDAWWLTSRSGH